MVALISITHIRRTCNCDVRNTFHAVNIFPITMHIVYVCFSGNRCGCMETNFPTNCTIVSGIIHEDISPHRHKTQNKCDRFQNIGTLSLTTEFHYTC